MLIQMDGSYHPWLADQTPPFTLLIAVDDATGKVMDARFCEQEDTRGYFLLIRALVERRVVPVAPVHRSPRGIQAHAGIRPPLSTDPVQPGHG